MKINPAWLHPGGALLFLLTPVFMSPDFSMDFHFIHVPFFQKSLLMYLLLLGFFYINYYVLMPRLIPSGKYGLYTTVLAILFFAGSLALFLFLRMKLAHHHPFHPEPRGGEFHGPPPHLLPPPHHRIHFAGEAIHFLPGFLFMIVVSFFIRTMTNLRQIQKEKAVSELNFLKSQINPHFLFNSLNSIYALSLQKSDRAPESILNLSSMMRYVLYETRSDQVSVASEIEYINHYIELNRLRLSANIHLDFKVEGEIRSQKIAPLILIPYIENVFKHGVNTEKELFLKIHLMIGDNSIRLITQNEIAVQRTEKNSGLGLELTKKRLDLIYPGKYRLEQRTENHQYYLELKIELI